MALSLLVAALSLLASQGCDTRVRPTPEPPASSSPTALPPSDPGASRPPDAAAASEDGGASAAHASDFDRQRVDGGYCSRLQACWDTCCGDDEHCNVYQCYRPLLCGPGLPACPEMTYCEDYDAGRARCADASHRAGNEESCARMAAGAGWMAAHAKDTPRARGTCFPVMAPHRLGGVRWYRALGRDASRKVK